jgi:hypothetical protein
VRRGIRNAKRDENFYAKAQREINAEGAEVNTNTKKDENFYAEAQREINVEGARELQMQRRMRILTQRRREKSTQRMQGNYKCEER